MPFLTFFWLLVSSCGIKSLNGKSTSLARYFSQKLTSNGTPTTVTDSAISQRMKHWNYLVFRDIFLHLLSIYHYKIPKKISGLLDQFQDVRAVDASVIKLCKKLQGIFDGSNSKPGLKIHCAFSILKNCPEQIKISSELVSEKTVKFLNRAQNVLYLLDLGYWSYPLIDSIINSKNLVLMRLRADCNPYLLEIFTTQYKKFEGKRLKEILDNLEGKTFDAIVRLNAGSKHPMDNLVRLCGVFDEKEKEWRFYVTNLERKFSPEIIYELYRLRWQVEIFFCQLKHILDLRRICSKNENGIKIEIFSSLIYYMLTQIAVVESVGAKFKDISFKKAFEVFRSGFEEIYVCLIGIGKRKKIEKFWEDTLWLIKNICKKSGIKKKKKLQISVKSKVLVIKGTNELSVNKVRNKYALRGRNNAA